MSRRLICGAGLAAALSLGAAGVAPAQEFTLTVPVRISKVVPGVTGGVVLCVVGPLAVAVVNRPSPHPGERVGFGAQPFPIDPQTRDFSGSVVVPVDAEPGRDPAAATHYKCWLQLTSEPDKPGGAGVPLSDATEASLLPRPNTPFSQVITGEVPR